MADANEMERAIRRYTDAEVRLLLEKAARVQGRMPAARQPRGLTSPNWRKSRRRLTSMWRDFARPPVSWTSKDPHARYGELAGGLFGGVLGGVGGGVGVGAGSTVASALGSVALAVAIPAAVIGGSYAACRLGFGAYVRSRARQLNAICERIVRDLSVSHEDEDA
jgi:hypothetical protein